ncbi:MAG TPA: hypothetical protein VLU43_07055 [Anaeromyxobacteraceae bacterium]|nr:hypothetical protein [Anaeromyxobacteraceae bacterium]
MPTLPLRPLSAAAVVAVLLSACVAHDKAGDRAAAVGDWKAAYFEYRQAVADKPDDPVLRQKFAEAQKQGMASAGAHAQACQAQGDWTCVLGEADFMLTVNPGDVNAASLRRAAAHSVALQRVQQAREEISRGQLPQAAKTLESATALSAEADVVAAAGGAQRQWVSAAVGQADQLRAQRRYPEALQLLQTATSYDPGVRPRLDAVQREYDAFRRAEHDRLVREADQLLAQNAWPDAAARYAAAQQQLPDERAKAAEAYARLALAGDQAVERGDYRAAARAYGDAAQLRVDPKGYAQAQLALVQIRPYGIHVRKVVVSPTRPDGVPWVGPPDRELRRVARVLEANFGGTEAQLALSMVPHRNRPTLFVEVILPDGRRLVTAEQRRSLVVQPDATVVLAANGYDRRRIAVRVFHQEPGGVTENIAAFDASVGELVSRQGASLQGPSATVELVTEPADGMADGAFANLRAVEPPPAPPPGRPPAPPPARRP